MKTVQYFILILCVIMVMASPVLAKGESCADLRDEIKQERNLLKKREKLSQALELCPLDAKIRYSYAYAAERLRKYNSAQSNYLKATELDRNYAKAYFGLADIYMVLGNAKSAIGAYEKGLAIVPQNKRAKTSLGLAKIKYKAEQGEQITSAEFIEVMQKSKNKETTEGAVDGPLLRMQIHFHSASSQLSQQAMGQLEGVGKALEDRALKGKNFEISGHTDNTGPPESNMVLSKHRAEQVRQYLLKTFIIQPESLVVAYYGDTRPAVPNTTIENRAINRRVEFRRLEP